MRFTDLAELSLDLIDLYRERFAASATELADAAPNSRLAWNQGYHYRYHDDGQLFTAVSDGGIFSRPHFCLPLGELTVDALLPVIKSMEEIFKAESWPLCSMFIDEKFKPLYELAAERLDYFIEWDYNDDFTDYVYDAAKLRSLSGKRYRTKRNHINQFLRDFPAVEYRPLSAEMAEQALQLVLDWGENKDVDPDNMRESDYLPIKYLFTNFAELNLKGGAIYLGDLLLAFAIGSQTREDIAVIHFEKANPNLENIYAVINRWVAEEAFPEVKEINREEDMGIEGMRLAKESYHPLKRLRKYRANFIKKCCAKEYRAQKSLSEVK
ncbi:MAG: phosphatidylglycerol lysyltransferase domain-containing protein [Eubacteriales bacterium]|nr:phosphatidylglycerol lysyltransferase domain-containing protein [Eubacteriales bacterium]